MAAVALAGRTGEVLAGAGDVRELLTRAERDRADALRSAADRDDFVAAHALVRFCAAELLGRPARSLAVVQSCDRCDRPHGRPRLDRPAGVGVSLAHSRGWVAAAAAHGPVGIDIEADDGVTPLDRHVAARACGPAELSELAAAADPRRTFLRQWVRKEALVKVGEGALDDVRLLDLPVHRPGPVRRGAWRLTDWSAAEAVGCVAALEEVRLRTVSGSRTALYR
ncbi:4'-phosphopantetheinyl transferase family protein [Streptomyces sp. NRRL S-118]|uniref:4'-phosphopantetheinyl transferase family protein n=1 Tax=Streptomyces sp. NRRL S-118 TaxID=1463881 RepID=UPI000693F97F|nr:4'-phosphopantetheinyl transferase superfamily protein [Streptomyces sp. NRRL S-118]